VSTLCGAAPAFFACGRRAFFARAKSPEASGATTEPDTGVTGARAKLVRATPADLADLLGADPALRDVVRYDTLRRCVVTTGPLPWESGSQAWSNVDNAELQIYAETRHRLLAGIEMLSVAVHAHAWRRRFHPVRDCIASLAWDGEPRLDTWLISHCGAPDTPYVRAVSRRFLVSAVARACWPGCKADCLMILEGPQGIGKSTAFRVLAGDAYFSDTPLNFADTRQTGEALAGAWIL
jgi:predicted P-loop ATPase